MNTEQKLTTFSKLEIGTLVGFGPITGIEFDRVTSRTGVFAYDKNTQFQINGMYIERKIVIEKIVVTTRKEGDCVTIITENNNGDWRVERKTIQGKLLSIEYCRNGKYRAISTVAMGVFTSKSLSKRFYRQSYSSDGVKVWFTITPKTKLTAPVKYDPITKSYEAGVKEYPNREAVLNDLSLVGHEDKVDLQNARIAMKEISAFDENAFAAEFTAGFEMNKDNA